MRNFLQQLSPDHVDLLSDELSGDLAISPNEILRGDLNDTIVEIGDNSGTDNIQVVEEQSITDTAIEQVVADSVTLESLVAEMKSAIIKNGALTVEGSIFAHNHIRSTMKRYVHNGTTTLEGALLSDPALLSAMTLESAEHAEKTIWERFKAMAIASIQAVNTFFSGLFSSIDKYKKVADSIIARARELKGDVRANLELTGNPAFFAHSVTSGRNSFIPEADKNANSLQAVVRTLRGITKDMEAIHLPSDLGDENNFIAQLDEQIEKLYKAHENSSDPTILPFGKRFTVQEGLGGGPTVDDNPKSIRRDTFTFEFSPAIIIALSVIAKKYLDLIPPIKANVGSFNDKLAHELKEAEHLEGTAAKWKQHYLRLKTKMGLHRLGQQIANIIKHAAVVSLSVANRALKALED